VFFNNFSGDKSIINIPKNVLQQKTFLGMNSFINYLKYKVLILEKIV